MFELLQFGVDVEKVFRQFEVFVFHLFSEVGQVGFEVGGFVDDLIEQNNVLEFLNVLDFEYAVFDIVDVFFEVVEDGKRVNFFLSDHLEYSFEFGPEDESFKDFLVFFEDIEGDFFELGVDCAYFFEGVFDGKIGV